MRILAGLAIAMAIVAPGSAQLAVKAALSPSDIQAAIAAARQPKQQAPYQITQKADWARGENVGFVYTPFSRVVLAARKAFSTYKPFTPRDVTPELIEPLVYFQGLPMELRKPRSAEPYVFVEHIVIIPRGSNDPNQAIQPIWLKPDTTTLQNAFGATVPARGVVAAFPLSALRPESEFVLVYRGDTAAFGNRREVRVRIRDRDLAKWR